MPAELANKLHQKIETTARAAKLVTLATEVGEDSVGNPTARFRFGLSADADPVHTLTLELGEGADLDKPDMLAGLESYLAEQARRLQNPRPDGFVTLNGLPLSFIDFKWPFHHSASGADSYIVHGTIRLEDGQDPPLQTLVAASMTLTFLDFIPAAEQPYTEGFIYNAIRKIFDQGQLELLHGGGRQPAPITTRYYFRWKKQFVFTDTNEQKRKDYLALKTYWLSGVLGGGAPVWITDPRDAQYLNTTTEELGKEAAGLAKEGLLTVKGDTAAAAPALMAHADKYKEKLQRALDFTKPSFNEEMRAGHTNM